MSAIEADHVVCRRCGVSVNKLVGRYLFFRFGFRGRGVGPGPDTPAESKTSEGDRVGAICGACAVVVLNDWEWFLRSADTNGLERGQGTHPA